MTTKVPSVNAGRTSTKAPAKSGATTPASELRLVHAPVPTPRTEVGKASGVYVYRPAHAQLEQTLKRHEKMTSYASDSVAMKRAIALPVDTSAAKISCLRPNATRPMPGSDTWARSMSADAAQQPGMPATE